MATTDDKFVINKGMVNEFILTIKQNDSTSAMEIDPTDTFEVRLYLLETNELVSTIDLDGSTEGSVEVYDATNGQILVKLEDALVDSLITERGKKPDRYYLRPTYRLAVDCSTINNGNFVAKIANVYVEA